MFVVKSHAAEGFESRKFERLARADWQAHLGKKRMKAFIPEIITAVYAVTIIALFGVGTWIISLGKFDGAGMISFVTSLVLLIEPIQVSDLLKRVLLFSKSSLLISYYPIFGSVMRFAVYHYSRRMRNNLLHSDISVCSHIM